MAQQSPSTALQMPKSGQELLTQAIDDFNNGLSDEERIQFAQQQDQQAQPPYNALALVDTLRKNKKSAKFASRCQPFIESVQQFSGIVNTMIQHNPNVSALIWGSVKFLLLTAQNYFLFFENLANCLAKLGKLCPIFEEFLSLLPNSSRLKNAVSEFYAHIIIFCNRALAYLRLPVGRRLFRASVASAAFDFEGIEDTLSFRQKLVDYEIRLASQAEAVRHRHTENLYRDEAVRHQEEEIKLLKLNAKVAQRTEARMVQWQNTHANERLQIELLRKGNDRQLEKISERVLARKQLLKGISDYDHRVTFQNKRSQRHNITGDWLYKLPQFQQWIEKSSSSILWCHGIPGSGKSVLSTAVIDHLVEANQEFVFIGYFFCDFAESKSLLSTFIIRSLIRQMLNILHGSPKFEEEVAEMIKGRCGWCQLFICATKLLPHRAYFVIDGIDECSEENQRQLLQFIERLMDLNQRKIKFYISSRPDRYIMRYIERAFSNTAEKIDLNTIESRPEIGAFIEDSLTERQNDGRLFFTEKSILQEIKVALMNGAKGMFLWVHFQILDISRMGNTTEIRAALLSLPRDLNETYARILKRIISERRKEVAIQVFTWVSMAKRPLLLTELAEAVALRPSDRTWHQVSSRIFDDPEKILENCGNLVTIASSTNTTVEFAHSTVHQFLSSFQLSAPLDEFKICTKFTDLYIGQICLAYLNFPELHRQVVVPQDRINVSFPLAASTIVPAEISPKSPLRILGRMVNKASDCSTGIRLYDVTAGRDNDPSLARTKTDFTLLKYILDHWIYHCAELPSVKRCDQHSWIYFRKLIIDNKPFTVTLPWAASESESDGLITSISKPPLFFAFKWSMENKHHALFQLVSSEVAQVNPYILAFLAGVPTPYGVLSDQSCSFLVASSLGYTLLLEAQLWNSDDEAQREYTVLGGNVTALMGAAEGGHVEVVDFLLNAGADVNHIVSGPPGDLPTALSVACAKGNFDIVERLLQLGGDVTACAEIAVVAAARCGHLRVLKCLIDAGAIDDVEAYIRSRAMVAAASGGQLRVLEFLIDAYAEAIGVDVRGRAMVAAASGGHLRVLEFLIDAYAEAIGVDVRAGAIDGVEVRSRVRAMVAAAESGNMDKFIELFAGALNDIDNKHTPPYLIDATLMIACSAHNAFSLNKMLQYVSISSHYLTDFMQIATVAALRHEQTEVIEVLFSFWKGFQFNRWEWNNDSGRVFVKIDYLSKALEEVSRTRDIKSVNCLFEFVSTTQVTQFVDLEAIAILDPALALVAASKEGHEEILLVLLKHIWNVHDLCPRLLEGWAGPKGEYFDRFMDIAFEAAKESGNFHIATILLETLPGFSTIHMLDKLVPASQNGDTYIVKTLVKVLNKRVFVAPAREVNTIENLWERKLAAALVASSQHGHLEVINQLLVAGADPGTGLPAASQHGHVEVVNQLLVAGADPRAGLPAASQHGHVEVVNRLLKAGADVNGNKGEALRKACINNNILVVNELIAAGANVHLFVDGGQECLLYTRSPLLAAARFSSSSVFRILLNAGADVNAVIPGVLSTVLHVACVSDIDSREKVRLLLKAGANLLSQDSGGRTPLKLAEAYGNREVVELLQKEAAKAG